MLPYRSAPGIPCELASLPRPLKGASGPEGAAAFGVFVRGFPLPFVPGSPSPWPSPTEGRGDCCARPLRASLFCFAKGADESWLPV